MGGGAVGFPVQRIDDQCFGAAGNHQGVGDDLPDGKARLRTMPEPWGKKGRDSSNKVSPEELR